MASKNHYSIYSSLGQLTAAIVFAFSVFTIISSFSKDDKYISCDRLRKAYDGLSPRDYQ